jgi:hypothetical protein
VTPRAKASRTKDNLSPGGIVNAESSNAVNSRVRSINGRMPINAEYAGKIYPLEKLPLELRHKYPHSVPFTGTGHPDFSRYAVKKVKISMTGNRYKDNKMAN